MKPKLKERAILISIRSYGESSLICQCFGSSLGSFACIAKGIRQQKQSSTLAALCEYEMLLHEPQEQGLYTLCEHSLLQSFSEGVCSTYLAAAFVAGETLTQLILDGVDVPDYYVLLTKYLSFLQVQQQNHIMLWWRFMLRLFRLLGIPLQLCQCSLCHHQNVLAAAYDPHSGETICANCIGNNHAKQHVFSDETRKLLSIINVIGNYLNTLNLSKDCILEIDQLLLDHYRCHLHKPLNLKSLKVLEQFY